MNEPRLSAAQFKAIGGKEQRTRVGRFLRFFAAPWLDALYYWFDLRRAPANGEVQGHPDHNKVLSTIAFLFGLVGVGIFGVMTVRLGNDIDNLLIGVVAIPTTPEMLSQLVKAYALSNTALLAYAALVFGMAFGLSGFRVWAKTRGGGTTEALGKAAEAVANAEIEKRRQLGGDYEVTE